jgi:hypothetical protein
VRKDLPVFKVRLVLQDHRVLEVQDPLVLKVLRVFKDLPAIQDHKVPQVLQALKVLRVFQAHPLVHPVSHKAD